MTPSLARIKRGVREAIHSCGGVDGAGATAGRKRSVAGDWNNLNHDAFPPIDCAIALDEVCIAQGKKASILSALSAELGHVCIRLPDVGHGEDGLSLALIDASAEFGDIAAEVREATRDGVIESHERNAIVRQIDETIEALARLRAVANGGK
ncbi:phage regulatory CII family protein [Novosphingobium sp. KN65.2]|uniref:phage regulatory CII family protein n=1 Tax=Novosphingobium sp. KN65.2 TaxID=1478134 RepID=UPI0005E5C94C|nr:phage regulatory CII family protein [Novosphingobium sp. KN65.2]CDO35020.1 conserved hypothetical protein [Novosphingobium sp. KN65.2]